MSSSVLLLNDTSTDSNLGCQATMFAINGELDRLFRGYAIERIYLPFIARAAHDPRWKHFLPSRRRSPKEALDAFLGSSIPEVEEAIELIRNSEIILVNGEGSINENRRTRALGTSTLILFTLMETAFHFGKEVHLLNCTIHITRARSTELAARVIDKCATVSVREPYSYYYSRQIRKDVKLFPDLVCTLRPPEHEHSSVPFAMFGGSSAATALRRRGRLPARVAEFYRPLIDFLQERGVHVKIVKWPNDEFLEELGDGAFEHVSYDYRQYMAACTGALFNFTGRHHGIVMSFASGCPFLALSANTFKTNGDEALYGVGMEVENFERPDVERIQRNFSKLIDYSDRYKKKCEEKRKDFFPFAAGALENVLQPVEDLVSSGVYVPSRNPKSYTYDLWHDEGRIRRFLQTVSRVIAPS